MNNKHDSNQQSYLAALQKMKEDDFSRNIIKPLFESMDFSRVDFVGGPFEEGKDLIAEYAAPLKGNQVYVIQTKKIGECANTSEKTILSQLILQLQQCFVKEIKLHNGASVLPSAVYLATPYKVGNRLLKEIHELLNLSGKVVEILDGPKILQLIYEYNPNLIEGFLSVKDKLFITDVNTLNNLELISALNQSVSVHDMNCYSDLAFFMGTIDSNILLDSTIMIKEESFSLEKDKWDLFKKEVLLPLETFLGFPPLREEISYYDEKYEREYKLFQSEKNKQVRSNIIQAQQLINGNENSIREVVERVNATRTGLRSLSIDDNYAKLMDEFSVIIRTFLDKRDQLDSHIDIQTFIDENKIKESSNLHQKSVYPDIMNAFNCAVKISQQNRELKALNEEFVNIPRVNFQFKTTALQEWINKKCRCYKSEIFEINSNNANVDLILFLSETQKILNVLEILIKRIEDSKRIIDVEKKKDYLCDGLSISPFKIFETKHDIAIYGGAGAGKTTTLQMYVRKAYEDKKLYGKVIYIPLNRFINKLKIALDEQIVNYNLLIELILLASGMSVSKENQKSLSIYFNDALNLRLVLDGLDEAYVKYPGIIDAINEFKIKHPNIQMLISSRDCVSYLSKINFLGITLLPFTQKQLHKFVISWFENKNILLGERVINKINESSLSEVFRTPLLATLLCDLVEKGVDIPSSESEIFSKRIELFCGMYDTYKDIKRTTLSQSILYKAAIKIGYAFHRKNIRSSSKKEMISILNNDRSFSYDSNTCDIAVSELINPCNIIIYDALSETYSFGHLRYQEHLACQELLTNRSVDIIPYLKSDWWRGALCLYAQSCEFYEMIEAFTLKHHNIGPALITFYEMMKYRPVNERANIQYLLEKYEQYDDNYFSDDNYTSSDDYY